MADTATTQIDNTLYSEQDHRFLAPYACFSSKSRGRLHDEAESPGRSPFQRDRDRIIHATAFRRLEYKTQVFVYYEGDHYRTRLTHSLEVAQLARDACRELYLNEDLAESIALAHDLGHTPFGHAGEDILKTMMKQYGGFDHNAQAIRILTKLENKYISFNGLNLTWECLEGIAKHNGPIADTVIPRAMAEYNKQHDLELHGYASLEAQISALCDDIAYISHDIEDGLRADLFPVESLHSLPLIGEIFSGLVKDNAEVTESSLSHESKRRIINHMVNDLIVTTRKNLERLQPNSVDDIRKQNEAIAAFSPAMQDIQQQIKSFLMEHMYRHYKVNIMTSKAKRVIRDLFDFFLNNPHCLPTEWRKQTDNDNMQLTATVIADFIAGMTDRFAFKEHQRIFDISYRLIGD